MRQDLMDVLHSTRDTLNELVLNASPVEAAALAEGRDRVSEMIQDLIELDYQGTAEGLDQATQELRSMQAELVAAKSRTDMVKTAIEIAGKVGAVVAGIVGAVA